MEPVILNNTYRLERRLTAGGMGAVFVGSHLRIKGRKYAIKKLHAELASNESFQKRFAAEAEAMMELNHDNIVRIEDFLVQGEDYYLVMEFVEGEPLDALLHRERKLTAHRAGELFRQLLLGLEFCHSKGIIHRDLKPSNLLLTKEGNLKITDFGIARQEKVERGLTQTGTILGTPDYMSPEQIVGEKPDQRSDLYSCGVILYEMLVGRTPYASAHESDNNYAILYAHLHQEPDPITDPNVPSTLKRLVERCLEKRPQDRLQSTKDALRLLKQGKEDTGLDPSTRDWQKLGLEGRPGPEALQGKNLATGSRLKSAAQDFRIQKESMTSDFERPASGSPSSAASQSTQHVSKEEQRALTGANSAPPKRSLLIPLIAAIFLMGGGGAGAYYAFFSGKKTDNGSSTDGTGTDSTGPQTRRIVPRRETQDGSQKNGQQGNQDSNDSAGNTAQGSRKAPPRRPVVVRDRAMPADAGAARPTPRTDTPTPRIVPRRRPTLAKRNVPDTSGKHPAYKWPSSVSKMCRFFLKICMNSCIKTRQHSGDVQAEKNCRPACWKARGSTNGRKFCQ